LQHKKARGVVITDEKRGALLRLSPSAEKRQ
jgi:hypothetical protein